MHIPNEIVLAIVRSLRRTNLKAASLVSRSWCLYASELLFGKVYVALNRLDFEAITQHPLLSNWVRWLICDGPEVIIDCTRRQYVEGIRSQTTELLIEYDNDSFPLEDGGSECIALIEDCYSILGLDVAAFEGRRDVPEIHRVEKSRDYNTECHSQRCHRTPQLVSIPDAGPQKSRAWRNRAPGQYLGSCHRVSHRVSASVHLRHPIPHWPALSRWKSR